jgi:hypothetical protein
MLCDTPKESEIDNVMNVFAKCETNTPEADNILPNADACKEVTILLKMQDECRKERIHVSLFGYRESSQCNEIIHMNRYECELKVSTQKCEESQMICDATKNTCYADNTPAEDFSWLS